MVKLGATFIFMRNFQITPQPEKLIFLGATKVEIRVVYTDIPKYLMRHEILSLRQSGNRYGAVRYNL